MDGNPYANQSALFAPTRPGVCVRLAMVALSLGAISAELVIVVAMLGTLAPFSLLVLAQLALAGILLGGTLLIYWCGGRNPSFLLLTIATVVMGPFGAVGA